MLRGYKLGWLKGLFLQATHSAVHIQEAMNLTGENWQGGQTSL
jgi:hypothetical protein